MFCETKKTTESEMQTKRNKIMRNFAILCKNFAIFWYTDRTSKKSGCDHKKKFLNFFQYLVLNW